MAINYNKEQNSMMPVSLDSQSNQKDNSIFSKSNYISPDNSQSVSFIKGNLMMNNGNTPNLDAFIPSPLKHLSPSLENIRPLDLPLVSRLIESPLNKDTHNFIISKISFHKPISFSNALKESAMLWSPISFFNDNKSQDKKSSSPSLLSNEVNACSPTIIKDLESSTPDLENSEIKTSTKGKYCIYIYIFIY